MLRGGAYRFFACVRLQHILAAKQFKIVSVNVEQAVFLHFTQFIGEGAAIDAEIICQLLTVERNGKAAAAAVR